MLNNINNIIDFLGKSELENFSIFSRNFKNLLSVERINNVEGSNVFLYVSSVL